MIFFILTNVGSIKRYIKTQVTGSAQLIYGFSKIPVIHKKFTKFYDFDTTNAIIYQDLIEGMKTAINMSNKEYKKYIKQMKQTEQKIYQESLNNLKGILNG